MVACGQLRSHCSKLIVVPCVQNFTVNECGAVHITMGDGGNIEGLCKLLFLP